MREKLRNDLLTLLNFYVPVDQLKQIGISIERILSEYEIGRAHV